jgi:co-chaperonin GroES (HSP10)
MANYIPIHSASGVRALRDHVICEDIQFGEQKTTGGIVLMNDNGKTQGIRPRWACVYAVGPEQKDLVPGQWILIEHGRWTRAVNVEVNGQVKKIVRVDTSGILAVSDTKPENLSTFAGDHVVHTN